ncbi:MAG: acyl-CoA dehydrogenase family protein [Burkholderiaceae bacterium]
MDLKDRKEHRLFREEVRRFIRDHKSQAPADQALSFRLNPKKYSKEARRWQRLLVKHGMACRTVPAEFGGLGARPDILKQRIIEEEFLSAGVPQSLQSQGISMLVPTLLEHGSEEQKKRWIEPVICGDIFFCQGYSEPGAGSDLASLKTRAVDDGDDFIINGQKIWTSSAHIAEMIFCLIRTEAGTRRSKGISYLIFPMNTPGIEVRPLQTMTGHPSFNEVFFTDVRVPKSSLVGQRGQGWAVANSTLNHERGMLSSANASLGRFNRIVALMKRETVNGRPLSESPVLLDRLIRLQAQVHAMRFHEMRLASDPEKGSGGSIDALVCKLVGCDLNFELDALAIDICGEAGIDFSPQIDVTQHTAWQPTYMYDLGLIIGGGTAQIQKNIIAERGLKMPRETRTDKG